MRAMLVLNAGKQKKLREFRMNVQGKRILWINPVPLDTHLYQASSVEILKHMAERGHSLALITTRSANVVRSENPRARIIPFPLRYVPFLSPIMFTVLLFFFLPLYIIVSDPQFIIATQPEVSILGIIPGLVLSKIKRTKSVLDVRSTPVESSGFRGSQQKLWFSICIVVAKKLFDGMTIITPLMRKEICDAYAIDPCSVGTWSSGVDNRLFDPESHVSEGARLKRELGLSGRFVVFYHGVLTATRGLTETVETMRTLGPDCSDVVLFLLGKGPAAALLKRAVQEHGLQDRVIIHDSVDYAEVPGFIMMADVCIVPLPDHPYWRSQSPLKLLEYLAMEKVVILTDIPSHRSVVGEEKCGIYISSVTPAEIAESIAYAHRNRERLAEWGKTGRAIVNDKYVWEKVAQDLENCLLSIDDTVD